MASAAGVSKEVVMTGYLEKKSPKAVLGVRAWQRRFFELVLMSSAARGNELSLFYHKSESDSLEKKEPLGEIVLNEILGVTARKEKGEGRFDIEVPTRVFSLKCENPAELKRWIAVLQSMTQMASFQKPAALPSTPAETMRLMAQNSAANPDARPDEQGFDQASATLELMVKGQAFIKYTQEKDGKTRREIVLVFYKKDATPLGSLYYCEPGMKTEDVDGALALHTLTDLYLGKQSVAFKSPIAAHAESKKCFTALGTNRTGGLRELNLEGDSKEQVAAWLFGINAILTHKGGRKVMTAEDSAREEAKRKAKIAEQRAAEQAKREEEKRKAEEAAAAAQKAEEEAQAAQATAAAEAERAQAAAQEEAERNAREQAEQERSAADKEAAERRAAESAAAAAAAAEAAAAAQQAAEAAAAERARVAAEAEAAEKAAAEAAAAAEKRREEEEARVRREEEERIVNFTRTQSVMPEGVEALAEEARRQQELERVPEDQALASETASKLSLDVSSTSSSDAAPVAVPVSPSSGTEETAASWLAGLGEAYPGEYGKLFRDNGVDLHFLVGLGEEELKDIGVKNALHLKKMLSGIEALRATGKYSAPPKVLPTQKEDIVDAASPRAASASVSGPVAIPTTPVGQFLYKLGPLFLQYLKTFEDNGVDLNFLLTLNDDDLEELGVSKLHRKKIVQEIKDYRAQHKMAPAASPAAAAAPSSDASSSSSSAAAPAAASVPSSTTSGSSATSTGTTSGGYLSRAKSVSKPIESAPVQRNAQEDILNAIREAKEAKARAGPQQPVEKDDIDLAGTSIAAIAARMAAQREAREKAKAAAAAAANPPPAQVTPAASNSPAPEPKAPADEPAAATAEVEAASS